MRVLGGGDHDGIEVVGAVEYAAEVIVFLRFREPLGRGVHGILVHVAEDRDVFGRNARRRAGGGCSPGVSLSATPDAVALHVVQGTASAGDHGNIELVVEVLTPHEGRGSDDRAGRHRAADQLAPGYAMLRRVSGDLFLHGMLFDFA